MYSNCLYVTFTNISKTRQNHWNIFRSMISQSLTDTMYLSTLESHYLDFVINHHTNRMLFVWNTNEFRSLLRMEVQKQKNPGSSCKKTSNNQTSLDDIFEWVNNCYESVYAVLVAILCRRILSISSSFTMNWYVDLSYSHRSHSHGRSIMNLMLTDERHLRLVYLCFPMCRQ